MGTTTFTLTFMLYQYKNPWKPLSPTEVASIFRGTQFPWWIAGGYTIEHFVGRQLRVHTDIDILALRRDVAALRRHLAGWDCWVANPTGELRSWRDGEAIGREIHDVWCRKNECAPWAFQVMLDESDGLEWQSRRCSCVRMPLRKLGAENFNGIPFLAPEIQLFYKAKCPRTKDDQDFEASLPLLAPAQRTWLTQAIERAYGTANIWAERLRALQ